MKYTVVAILMLFLSCSCEKEHPITESKDEQGVVIDKDFLWKTLLVADNPWVSAGGINVPIYKGMFITASQFEDLPKIVAVDIFTGEVIWEWRDYIDNDINKDFIHIKWPYVYENKFVIKTGPRTYCIDLDTGKTLWNDIGSTDFNHPFVTGKGDRFVVSGIASKDTLDYVHWTSYMGSLSGSELTEMPYPPYTFIEHEWERIANWYTGGALFEKEGKEYLVCTYQRISDVYSIHSSLNLYNMTDEKWEYAQKMLVPPKLGNHATGFPIISEDIVVTSIGYNICANDVMTGDSLWVYEGANSYLFGGFFIHEGKVYVMEEVNGLHCFDLHTGEKYWTMQQHGANGTTSHMAHLNGIIYYTSGGNGHLMAVDMENGELLWNIASPDVENFRSEIEVQAGENGEKGRVVTSTYQSALAYEAIR